jgi:hypothetical protein
MALLTTLTDDQRAARRSARIREARLPHAKPPAATQAQQPGWSTPRRKCGLCGDTGVSRSRMVRLCRCRMGDAT